MYYQVKNTLKNNIYHTSEQPKKIIENMIGIYKCLEIEESKSFLFFVPCCPFMIKWFYFFILEYLLEINILITNNQTNVMHEVNSIK